MLAQGLKYLHYYLTSVGPHGLHSPFVYELATKVLADKASKPAYAKVEQLRKQLLQDATEIEVTDFGAGGIGKGTYPLKISAIAHKAAKPAKLSKLLYRLCAYYKPHYMLELGTSLGISAAYQALGALENAKQIAFTTLEGSATTATQARKNLETLGLKNSVNVEVGNFDEILPAQLKQFPRLDYVFFDGNHRYSPTIDYFNQCLPLAHDNTLFIFDDIRWSAEMEKAWAEIKNHPQVTATVDLFFMGLVFFRKGQAKQDFVVRF